MLILFEGLDLSGKTTLCREIRRVLGWELRRNSLMPVGANPLYENAETARLHYSASDIEIGRLYLDALKWELMNYEKSTIPVIQDSTILLRSFAYHIANGNEELAYKFSELLDSHPRPLISFICKASPQKRIERLKGRIERGNVANEDLLVRDAPSLFARMEQSIEEMATRVFNAEFIDTNYLEDPDERTKLVASVCLRIRNLVNCKKSEA
jgi:thymidylate kinase